MLICFALKEEAAPFRKIAAGKAGIAILITGIGRRNAEKSLREYLNSCRSRGNETQIKNNLETPHVVSYGPDLVLTCGFAGGLNPNLKPGDVVVELTDSELANVSAAKVVDARGSACPGPLLEAKKGIGAVSVGSILEIWSSDPVTKSDISAWSGKVGHEFLGFGTADGYDRVFVKRLK